MIKPAAIWRQESLRIPMQIVLVYLLWKVFHYYAGMPGTALHNVWEVVVQKVGTGYAFLASIFAAPMMMQAYADGINIHLHGVASSKTIWVQEHCLALPAMVVFSGTVIFFKGVWSEKVWFLLLGLLGIIIINTIRLVFVCMAWLYLDNVFFDLHHSFIYVAATYGFIFMMLAWWLKRNSEDVARLPVKKKFGVYRILGA